MPPGACLAWWGENLSRRDAGGRGRGIGNFFTAPLLRQAFGSPRRIGAGSLQAPAPEAAQLCPELLLHFLGSFPVMTAFAKTLQIVWVREQRPISPMGLDMVHNRGPDPATLFGALTAPRLLQQLPGPQHIPPQGQVIEPMPLGALPSFFLGLVLRAIALIGQLSAARIAAGPHWFVCHVEITPKNAKKPINRRPFRRWSIGSGSQAQALVNIHDRFPATPLAVNRQVVGRGVWPKPQHPTLAHRTEQPTFFVYHYTLFCLLLQASFPPFYSSVHLLYMVSRSKIKRFGLFSSGRPGFSGLWLWS